MTIASGVAMVIACSGALSACSVSRDDDDAGQSASRSPEPSPTAETPTVTVTATPTPTPTTTPTAPPALTGPEGALLTAAEMPPLNDSSAWTEAGTAAAGTEPFGDCQKFDLNSIGAMSTLERTFTSGGDTAGQQVADFADPQTAVRAARVLQSWHRDCEGRIQGRRVNVRPISNVVVSQGTGWWYLVSYTRQGQGNFHTLGLAMSNTRLSLLRMNHTGQDHNYEPGQDPMQLAVRAAAAKLGVASTS
jgi:hypothetical protein